MEWSRRSRVSQFRLATSSRVCSLSLCSLMLFLSSHRSLSFTIFTQSSFHVPRSVSLMMVSLLLPPSLCTSASTRSLSLRILSRVWQFTFWSWKDNSRAKLWRERGRKVPGPVKAETRRRQLH